MDEYCGKCGALLTPGDEWCTLCFTPVVRQSAIIVGDEPQRKFEDPRLGKAPVPGETVYYNPPEFSRWRGGPSSLGPAAKIIMSMLLILIAVAAFTLVHGAIYAFTGFLVPANQLRIIYALAATPLVAWAFSKIWKRTRIK